MEGRSTAGDLSGGAVQVSEGCVSAGKRLMYDGNVRELMIPTC